MRALSTLCKSLLICFTSSTVKSKHFFDETSENPTQDCPSYLLSARRITNHCMFALVYADDLASAKLLRRHGARIDEVFDGETPLIYAMRHRRARFAKWLLSQGAN